MTWTTGPDAGMLRLADDRPAANGDCLRCAAEASRHARLADIDERTQVTSPEDAARIVLGELAGRDREHCVATLLDTKHRILSVVTVSVGSVDHTFMRPREILRDALLANAAALVLAHNHPSGDPEPSRDDELVTRRIVRAGEVVGIDVLDHLVVGGARWVSLARRGLL
ncbi:MAG: DNA repair protein RadC [Actinomycetota bacterium]|nr:DNA repair protein RadC [Actinomycetota bacterium]